MQTEGKIRLFCYVYGEEGSAFGVRIDGDDVVDELKDAIALKQKFKFPACRLRLFLAYHDGAWLKSDSKDVRKLKQGRQTTLLRRLTSDDNELPENALVQDVLKGTPEPDFKQIHVLVKAPRGSIWDNYTWDPATVERRILASSQQSVVRLSSDVGSGAAIVVDRTATHVYLMTTLHMWIHESFADHLSDRFTKQISRYLLLHSKPRGTKRNSAGDAKLRPLKPLKTSKKPQFVVERLLTPDTTASKRIREFDIDSNICWECSAALNFAIFEVAVPQDLQLVRGIISVVVYQPEPVYVLGFSGAHDSGGDYSMISGEVSGWQRNAMTLSLSAPCATTSGIVYTHDGTAVGYVGGVLDDESAEGEQYDLYAYTFHGMPAVRCHPMERRENCDSAALSMTQHVLRVEGRWVGAGTAFCSAKL